MIRKIEYYRAGRAVVPEVTFDDGKVEYGSPRKYDTPQEAQFWAEHKNVTYGYRWGIRLILHDGGSLIGWYGKATGDKPDDVYELDTFDGTKRLKVGEIMMGYTWYDEQITWQYGRRSEKRGAKQ